MPRPRHTALRIVMTVLTGTSFAAVMVVACPAAAQDKHQDKFHEKFQEKQEKHQDKLQEKSQEKTFDIPAEDAATALVAFVRQSGLHVLANARELTGVRTNAVHGRMDANTALDRLLSGTGLVINVLDFSPGDRSVAVGRAPPPPATRSSSSPPPAAVPAEPTVVVVTGYRHSLRWAAAEQRNSVNFTSAVYAEDIGKFPDLNLAESLQRVPGVQLTRDQITGEGIQVAIRALDPSFTNVLMNGERIEVASDGGLDGGSANRETDLDLFPSELFSRIIVSKTPRAEQLEGGIAGTVGLVPLHPFEFAGPHVVVSASDGYGQSSRQWSPRGSAIFSNTWDHWGALFGVAAETRRFETDGFESLGWSNANLNCPGCDNSQGNNFTFASVVPANAGNGLTPGAAVNYAALNPGVTLNQLTNALIPRLARNVLIEGQRTRVTAAASLQYWASEDTHWSLDLMWGHSWRLYNRDDADWYVRNSGPSITGGMVPIGLQVNADDVVTSGTFANSAFFDESTLRSEKLDYKSAQTHLAWRLGPRWRIEADAGLTRSVFRRDSTSFLFDTPFNSGITVHFLNTGGVPSVQTNADLNNPLLGWTLDRVNIQNMQRMTNTWGAHVNAIWQASPAISIKAGVAWDKATRSIFAWDNSPAYTAAFSAFVPQSAIASYLQANGNPHYLDLVDMPGGGLRNFVTANIPALMAASNYSYYDATAPVTTTTVSSTPAGSIDETYTGAYVQGDARVIVFGRPLLLDAGVRAVQTDQFISGPVIQNGVVSYPSSEHSYGHVLPAANAVWRLSDTFDLRAALSRTLSRPNPTSLLPGTAFSDPSAENATRGNPDLKPYFSDNIDVGADLRTGSIGYVSLALFQKRITGFTYSSEVTETFSQLGLDYNQLSVPQQQAIMANGGPNAAQVNVSTPVNADSLLTLRGLELTWVQPLDPIRPGLGLTATYTHLGTHYSGTTNLATGIAPYSYNLTAYYDHGPLSTHISYVFQAARETQNAPQNGLPLGLYAQARGQVDLSAGLRVHWFGRAGKLTLEGTNLTNAPYRMTFGYPGATYSVYNPGYQVLLGWQGMF